MNQTTPPDFDSVINIEIPRITNDTPYIISGKIRSANILKYMNAKEVATTLSKTIENCMKKIGKSAAFSFLVDGHFLILIMPSSNQDSCYLGNVKSKIISAVVSNATKYFNSEMINRFDVDDVSDLVNFECDVFSVEPDQVNQYFSKLQNFGFSNVIKDFVIEKFGNSFTKQYVNSCKTTELISIIEVGGENIGNVWTGIRNGIAIYKMRTKQNADDYFKFDDSRRKRFEKKGLISDNVVTVYKLVENSNLPNFYYETNFIQSKIIPGE